MGTRVDAVFDALADPSRRYLVERLVSLGESTPTELARELPMTRQAVSKHLEQLEQVGLARGSREGRRTVYQADLRPLRHAADWLERVGGQWDDRLAALRRHADERRALERE